MYFPRRHLSNFFYFFLTTPAFLCIAMTSAQAQVDSSSDTECNHFEAYASYMVLPSGQCLRMNYLTVMGQSGANLAAITEIYNEEFELNLSAEMNEYYRLQETEEERDARYESLARTGLARDAVAEDHQNIMGYLYPIHIQAVGIIMEEYQAEPRFGKR